MMRFPFPRRLPQRLQTGLLALGLLGGLVAFAAEDALLSPLAGYESRLQLPSLGTPEERLTQLEAVVFGEAQPGNPVERQQRLLRILQTLPLPGTTDHPATMAGSSPTPAALDPLPSAGDATTPDATDYPTITALERQVFSRDFIRDPLPTRLNRLEKKVFGLTYPQVALVDRVDRLLMRVPGSSALSSRSPEEAGSVLRSLPENVSQLVGRDAYAKLAALERRTFDGRTFPEKVNPDRLTQLEHRLFRRAYSGQSVDARLERLQGYYQQMDNPEAVAADRPPAIQSRPGFQPRPGVRGGPRQNIQVGSGFSSNSTMQYSPELLEMLPGHVRNQLQGGPPAATVNRGYVTPFGSTQSQSSLYSAPGTVVVEESTQYLPQQQPFYPQNALPSFQQPGINPALPQQGLVPFSGTTTYRYTQPLTQTGEIIPGAGYYSMPPSQGVPFNGSNNLPGVNTWGSPLGMSPANAALAQQMTQMEMTVYGQSNPYLPLQARLNQLEATVLGRNLTGYSDADRVANLQRAAQLQSVGKALGKGTVGKIGRTAGSLLYGVPMPAPSR